MSSSHLKLTELLIPASRYESLTYNIQKVPADKNILEAFPDLNEMPEFHEELPVDKNKALRLIMIQYDPKSFLRNQFPDWVKRKKAAAVLAGFTEYDEKTGLWPEAIDDILRCRVQAFNIMVIRFCRIFNNHLYSLLVTSQDIFYFGLESVLNYEIEAAKGKSELDVEKLRLELLTKHQVTQQNIDKYAKDLLNQEQEISLYNLKRDLFSMVDLEALQKRYITAERQAFRLKEQLRTAAAAPPLESNKDASTGFQQKIDA